MKAFCFGRNIRKDYDKTPHSTKTSPWYNRFKQEFPGPHIPFGALIELKPSPTGGTKETSHRKMKYGPAGHSGVLLGYNQHSGGAMAETLYNRGLT